jgi:hypothetical protein
MRRFLLATAVAATALVGTACGDTTGIGNNVAGSYELRTVNNIPLPVSNESGSRTIVAGELEIDNSGSNSGEFVERLQIENFNGSQFTETRFGTWERSGDELIFEYDDDGETRFGERVSSSRIVTEDDVGNVWSYQRF